jgi:hypothetical protein
MAEINWDKLDYIDLTPLQSTSSGIPIPTYGNFGGPGYSQGVFLVDPNPTQFNPTPVDALDQQFLLHDQASDAADTTSEQAVADLNLIRGIEAVSLNQLDAEASVYGGAATLVMIERLAASDNLNLLSPGELVHVTGDALQDIGRGLAGLDTDEIGEAAGWLNNVATAVGLNIGDASGTAGSGSPVLQLLYQDWLFH